MPICFQLIEKANQEAGPVKLSLVDDRICEHFKVSPDPVKYYYDWFDCIGFRLATGKTPFEIDKEFEKILKEESEQIGPNGVEYYTRMREILAFIDEHYESNSFRESK